MIEYSVSDGTCVLRLASPPVNAITFALLDELVAAIRRANADAEARGIVLTGDPSHFSAGADVNLFREIDCAEDAVKMSRVFQEAFQEVEDSPKPVAAAVSGKMMGSALELAMACHYRVCAEGTTFRMPEVNLGINPGAGGTGRLPRLVGPETALKMLLTAQTINAKQALDLGLVDAICESEALPERARSLLHTASPPRKTSQLTEKVHDATANKAAFGKANELLERGRPEVIAPLKITEAVRTGLDESFEAGLLKEQTGFAECMDTLATQNKIYLFFAARETSKVPGLADVEPARIAKAAVVGMGSMGTGIAHAFITAGVPVVVRDEDESALQGGMQRIRSSVEKRVAQGKLAEQRAERMLELLSTTTEWQEIADADLVIEAVFEDVGTKHSVLGAIEDVCRSATIVASNTSTLSLDVLAEGMQRPERLIGMHFFNPAHRMPLVEIIRRDGTADGVIATALKFAKSIGKTPVLVKNREGFLVNRIFIPYLKEAFWLLEDGATPPAIDAAMVGFGFPMGPLVLIDMAGLDILVHTDAVMRQAFPHHGEVSQVAVRLVEQGHLGQKTGSGVYKYERGDYTPHPNEAAEQLITEVQRESARAPREIAEREITGRLVLRMVNEAFHVLEEGIAQRESDIDAAMALGTGFPDFRGGVLRYARDMGIDNVLSQLERMGQELGERFSPPTLLREMKGAQ
jgi:3-hydroxyacyl-CoA dehydrogenase